MHPRILAWRHWSHPGSLANSAPADRVGDFRKHSALAIVLRYTGDEKQEEKPAAAESAKGIWEG